MPRSLSVTCLLIGVYLRGPLFHGIADLTQWSAASRTLIRGLTMRSLVVALLPVAVTCFSWDGVGRGAEPAAEKPQPRLIVQTGHARGVASVAFAPDGRWFVTGGGDGTARVWDSATGKELLAVKDESNIVESVAVSPDGRFFVTGGYMGWQVWDTLTGKPVEGLRQRASQGWAVFSPDGKRLLTEYNPRSRQPMVAVWDLETVKDKPLLELRHKSGISALAVSADGKRVLTASVDKTARLWDAETGKELFALVPTTAVTAPPAMGLPGPDPQAGLVDSVAISPDVSRLATGGHDQIVRVWDATTGKELLALKGHGPGARKVAFSPDGKRLAVGGYDAVRLWDAATGQPVRTLEGRTTPVAFSPDGKRLFAGGADGKPRLTDVETGKDVLTLPGVPWVRKMPVAVTPDGKQIIVGLDNGARVWDATAGQEKAVLKGHEATVTAVAISPDGKQALTGSEDTTARLWDARTGKELQVFKGHDYPLQAVAFSPDGKRVATGTDFDLAVRVWDAKTGKTLRVLKGADSVHSLAFSPDGKLVLAGSEHQAARLWEADTGKSVRVVKQANGMQVYGVAFSPDGKSFVTADNDEREPAHIYETETGAGKKPKKPLIFGKDAPDGIGSLCAAFSPDGKRVITGCWDNKARVWDAATGKPVLTLTGHLGWVTTAAFVADGKKVLTAGRDLTVRLWDAATGRELCRLVNFADNSWAVVDAAGRYDASNGGDVEGLHWVVGRETIALNQLKERYYEPHLLSKYLGFNAEPLRDVGAFKDVKLYPDVQISQKDAKAPVMDVALTNRGGGIGKVIVLVNGKELTGDARPRGATDEKAADLKLSVNLANDPRLVPGQTNRVEVVAYNADGYLCSRGMVREFDVPGASAADPPHLYGVVAGVSKYRGDKLNLRYAAKDADDFATALELAAGRLFDADKVHVTKLTGATPDSRPTRAALDKALGALKATKPGDLVVVYLAGHGVTTDGQGGEFHYLTADAQSADLADPEVRRQVSVSSTELTDLLKASPARKQVLILDTCHSGRVVEKLTEKRDVPGSQVRALERVKDRTGMHVLAGCAADSVSYEATRYGQGLLTYSLLLGIKGAKLREGEYVDVADLFGFAADKVPELARDIGGVQRPLIASPRGAPFDIGRLTAEDRQKVPLQTVKPMVIRSSFQLERPARDSLGLSKRIDERLTAASAVTRGAKLVFVDTSDFPGGVQPSGRYKIDGDKVTVSGNLFDGDKDLGSFTAEGAAGKPDELAEKVAAEIEKKLAAVGSK